MKRRSVYPINSEVCGWERVFLIVGWEGPEISGVLCQWHREKFSPASLGTKIAGQVTSRHRKDQNGSVGRSSQHLIDPKSLSP